MNARHGAKPPAIEEDIRFLRSLDAGGASCIHTSEMKKHTRQRLLQANCLIEVLKGWYVIHLDSARPFTQEDWHRTSAPFVAFYCNRMLGSQWHLSQECSLLHHIGELGKQADLTVHSPVAGGASRPLVHGCTLYTVKSVFAGKGCYTVAPDGLHVMNLAQAIIRVPPTWIRANREAYIQALSMVTDMDEFIAPILEANRTEIAGRIASALRQVGRAWDAQQIRQAVQARHLKFMCANPFREC